ncbi:MAG: hypothetical protein E3J72_18825 [Planctomycetota bacterium]|nr:MAG: hypothetical protein E3J72_18825 [Planctomycetota bacterium]
MVELSDKDVEKKESPFSRAFVHSLLSESAGHYHALGQMPLSVERLFCLLLVIFAGTFLFGAATGCYVAGHQIWITGLKVPLLFLSTLAICAPSMYILSLLIGARLSFMQALTVALTTIAVTSLVMVGWAPVMFVFARTLMPREYPHYLFLLLLALVSVGSGAIISIWHLARGFTEMGVAANVRWRVIVVWLLLYQFVGSQMTWLLRPFVGSSADTVRFEGNFYEAIPIIVESFFKRTFGG